MSIWSVFDEFEVILAPQSKYLEMRYYEVHSRVNVFEVNLNLKVSVISYLPNDMTVLEGVEMVDWHGDNRTSCLSHLFFTSLRLFGHPEIPQNEGAGETQNTAVVYSHPHCHHAESISTCRMIRRYCRACEQSIDTVTTVLHVYLNFFDEFEVICTPQNTSKLLRYYYEEFMRLKLT